MAEPIPAGSDVSAGTYGCDCGYELSVRSTQALAPCPECSNGEWSSPSGGNDADDPYLNAS
jgi:hypothetical protein